MRKIEELLGEAAASRRTISECEQRISALRSRRTADEKAVVDYAGIDLTNRDALLDLAARKQAIELVPAQIQQLDDRKGAAVRDLLNISYELRRALDHAASAEQSKIIKEIATLLEPYSMTMAAATGETFNPSSQAAASMPIIGSIAVAVNFTATRPNESNGIRGSAARSAETFDKSAIAYADEIEGAAKAFLSNHSSFIIEPFRSQLERARK